MTSTSQSNYRMGQGQASPQLRDVLGAVRVLETASSFQQNASTVRLGAVRKPRASNANLSRAAAVRQERQDKKNANEAKKAQVSCSLARFEPAPVGKKKTLSKTQLQPVSHTLSCFRWCNTHVVQA